MMHAFVSGELIRDPERRQTKSGNDYATALLSSGEALVSVTCFDSTLVDRLLELRKGDPVSVSGRLQAGTYTAKDGEVRVSLSVTAARVMTSPATVTDAKPRERTPRKPGVPARREETVADFDDPIPF